MRTRNAVGQAAYRQRQKETAYGDTRLYVWVSYDTKDDIEKLVRHTGKTKKETLAMAVVALRDSTLAAMDSYAERDDFRRPIRPLT